MVAAVLDNLAGIDNCDNMRKCFFFFLEKKCCLYVGFHFFGIYR